MLLSIKETQQLIESGKTLYLAGEEKLLKELPKGNWIGGTIPYFMDINGGTLTQEMIFVVEQPPYVEESIIKWYDETNLEKMVSDSPENGYSIVIIPATSNVHSKYAQEAPDMENIFYKQIIGWISGVHLDDLGRLTPKVFNGITGDFSADQAIVLHAKLPQDKHASIGIINIFEQGDGDTITFFQDGFSVQDCLVNGKKENLAEYLVRKEADVKFPLVADYHGTMVNVSFQNINKEKKLVDLYAPVFKDVEYKLARPESHYIDEFNNRIPPDLTTAFSCNCILNFLYSELQGKKTGVFTGPMTFGEIAYLLLNQTLVYLRIE